MRDLKWQILGLLSPGMEKEPMLTFSMATPPSSSNTGLILQLKRVEKTAL
jgi:hypothetical protein